MELNQKKIFFVRIGGLLLVYLLLSMFMHPRLFAESTQEDFIYLSDIEWERASVGWGEVPKKDASIDENIITLTNNYGKPVEFEKGIGTHAYSEIVYDISNLDYNYLTTWVGVDREMANTVASVQFQIYIDDVLKYESKIMKDNTPMEHVLVNISGANTLTLVVNDGGDGIGSDHSDWADAQLHKKSPIIHNIDTIKEYEGMELIFNDEFNSDTIDENKWQLNTVPENGTHHYANVVGKGENIWVEDGNLVIQSKEYEGNDEYSSTSAAVRTLDKFDFRYGRVDVRAKIPTETGMWPAIWMMPANPDYGWPLAGEIDIMELISDQPNKIWSTLHSGIYDKPSYYFNQGDTLTIDRGTFFDDYHVYSMEWKPGEISFYVDDHLITKIDDWQNWIGEQENGEYVNITERDYPAPFDMNFYLKLNLATGGWSQDVDETTRWGDRTTMKIDYVRVYQEKNPDFNYLTDKPFSNGKQGAIWYAQKNNNGTWENYEHYQYNKWTSSQDENDSSYISNHELSANFALDSTYNASAITFRAPYEGYVKVGLNNEVDLMKANEVIFNLTKGDITSTLSDILRSETLTNTSEDISSVKTYFPVNADDMIRFEILKSDNVVSHFEPTVEYIDQSEYRAFNNLEEKVSELENIDTSIYTEQSESKFESALQTAQELTKGMGDESDYINALNNLINAYEGLKKSKFYSVTFDLQGGKGKIPDQIVEQGKTFQSPEIEPKLEGHKFVHWSEQINGDPYNFNTSITENTVLYAVYEKLVDKTFLKETLEDAKQVNTTKKTKSSTQTLEEAILEAQLVLDSKEVTQNQIDHALKNLIDAMNNLETISTDDVDEEVEDNVLKETSKEEDSIDINNKTENKLPNTFKGMYNWLILGLMIFILGGLMIFRKKELK